MVDGEAAGVDGWECGFERGVLSVEGGEDVADGWVWRDVDDEAVGVGRVGGGAEDEDVDVHAGSVWFGAEWGACGSGAWDFAGRTMCLIRLKRRCVV